MGPEKNKQTSHMSKYLHFHQHQISTLSGLGDEEQETG